MPLILGGAKLRDAHFGPGKLELLPFFRLQMRPKKIHSKNAVFSVLINKNLYELTEDSQNKTFVEIVLILLIVVQIYFLFDFLFKANIS